MGEQVSEWGGRLRGVELHPSDATVPVWGSSCRVWLQAVDGVVDVQEFGFVYERHL